MDLEHPDITRTLRTGYPCKKAPTEMDANQNIQLYCTKVQEESQMDFMEKTRKFEKVFKEIIDCDTVIGAYINFGLYGKYGVTFQFGDVQKFLSASEGREVKFGEFSNNPDFPRTKRAHFHIGITEYFILLDENELEELERGLNE